MKKVPIAIFTALLLMAQNVAMGAITIKKANPVEKKQAAATDIGASLVPTVMGLISGVQEISKKQKDLTAECRPSSSDIDFVNKIIKEWAKTGSMTADEAINKLGKRACSGTDSYANSVLLSGSMDDEDFICVDTFVGAGNADMIWAGYPKAAVAHYCLDGEMTCSDKNRKEVTNMYDIINLVDFSKEDFTKQESDIYGKLTDKIENCSYAKLDAKKKAMWSEFLVNTISNTGQKTNTGSIMQAVGSVANSGGGTMGTIQSLGGIAAQFMGGQ